MKYISKEILQEVIDKCNSKSECFNMLGLSQKSNYSYKIFNHYVKLYDIDICKLNNKRKPINNKKIDINAVLRGEFPLYNTSRLRQKLIDNGIFPHQCSECKLTTWNDRPIPLDLDHINGTPTDHRLENLRLLCRNCHAQTSNFCGLNISVKRTKNKKLSQDYKISIPKLGIITEKDKNFIHIVNTSGIDYTKFGWVSKLAILLNMSPHHINRWMKTYMNDFYINNCFIRKKSAPLGV